jgi:nucleotide sugar dehydrogenase
MKAKPSTVAVLGLGYVGLPVAQNASRAGLIVTGFDLSPQVVKVLNDGHSHVDDISDLEVETMLAQGFRATSDPADLIGVDTFVICVPTPLAVGGGPDLTAVRQAGEFVASALSQGALVILESTTYPGTTDTVLRPILEKSGLIAGVDFHLAFSPERIDPGNSQFTFANTPKIVGGLTRECHDRAKTFYLNMVVEVVSAQGLREAEMAKLLENTYRHVNIALVNEMARFSFDLGINFWNVIDVAATKPFGFQAFYPGPGVGGHCIPIDPNYLSHYVRSSTGYSFRFVELAQEINSQMPAYVASRVQKLLNTDGVAAMGSTVVLLGVTYKANIADVRESPAIDVVRSLRQMGVKISYYDPYVDEWSVDGIEVPRSTDLYSSVQACDATLLLQNHAVFDLPEIAARATRLLDTRGVTSSGNAERL